MQKTTNIVSPVEMGRKATLFALGAIGVLSDETKRVFTELVKKGKVLETKLSKRANSVKAKVKSQAEETVEIVKEKVNKVKEQVQDVLPLEKKEN